MADDKVLEKILALPSEIGTTQAAGALGITRQAILEHIHSGQLKARKHWRNAWVIKRAALERFYLRARSRSVAPWRTGRAAKPGPKRKGNGIGGGR